MSSFLLDTSAFRAISRKNLVNWSERCRISISPVTFYELIRHLDEGGECHFRRYRGQVLKCRQVKILEDPFLETAESPGMQWDFNPSRRDDRKIIVRLIDQLKDADTLDDFYSRSIKTPSWGIMDLRHLCERMRANIKRDERGYSIMFQRIARLLQKKYPVKVLRGYKTIDIVKEVMFSSASKSAEKHAPDSNAVVDAVHCFRGYVCARAKDCLTAAGSVTEMKLPKNDMRDGWICVHLKMDTDRTLVTSDKKMREAVRIALRAYAEFYNKKPMAKVISNIEFRNKMKC
ncbi:MAG: hypothetical protein ACLFWL_11835 [Candidatus Brocadiia bacterium]